MGTGITGRNLSINSPTSNIVRGELVAGSSRSAHPAILFVHWLGLPKTTNRTEFEPDAIALARVGMTSLLIDAIWSKPNWFSTVGKSATNDAEMTRKQVVDLRCALDVLSAQGDVDRHRIAFVGHDFGAMFGALLAGADPRPNYYVLMAATPSFADWYLLGKTVPDEAAYRRTIAPYDTALGLHASHAKAFLFQFSKHDDYIPLERARAFAAAAPEPKTVTFYEATHELAAREAIADRREWLIKQLE
jgi:dienelactone hydrolase